jgi:serine/threonine protein kinase/tetratricopeptide (TPR) repeat protein
MPTWNPRANELFLKALELRVPSERQQYLDAACAGDAALRAEVQALLEASERAGSFLESPAPAPDVTVDLPRVSEGPGTVIGPYKLLEQIGEGGFGVVFMAEQTQPVRRKVALKVLKPGMDTHQVVARFEAERQALAIMDHPNIAKVFDGGATLSGRPYFVMELVKGMPITEFCDQNHLTTRQRLDLFIPVCQAVQHAHQKGIIHRDLKPSNVLVTVHDTTPVVKVIDFGVAKALGQELTEKTLFTAFAQMIGTPLYMSPEQAGQSGLDVDTRSDIYSLGVLLYELLTGTTPFAKDRFKKAAYDEIRRIIREEEPPKPSTRLSDLGRSSAAPDPAGQAGPTSSLASVSAMRHTEPAKLTKLIRGELDWIVMKALEKDRNRRYETASGFAADVQRYLSDEPVQACPPSAVYRLKKFVRRNKGPVLAAAVVLLALVAGIVGTTWGLLRAVSARQAESDERKRAEQEKQIAQAVRDFLQKKLLGQADVLRQADALRDAGGQSAEAKYNPTVRDLLDRAAAELVPEKIDAQFPKPLVQAEILQTIGETYDGIGEYRLAIDHLQRALDLRQQHLAPDHPDTLDTLHTLAVAYRDAGKLPDAVRLLEQVRDKRAMHLGPDHPDTLDTLHNLAVAYHHAGKLPEAVRLLEQVRDKRAVNLGPDHPHTLATMDRLAWAYTETGRFPEAIALYEKTLELRKATLGPDHPHTLETRDGLGGTYSRAGRFKEPIALHQETLKLRMVKLGPDHPHTLLSMNKLAGALHNAFQLKEAIALFEDTLKLSKAKLGLEHPQTLTSMENLGRAYNQVYRFKEAIALLEEALKLKRATLGHNHPATLTSMQSLAWAYQGDGRLKEALTLLEKALELSEHKQGRNHPDTLETMDRLAGAYRADGRHNEALALLDETVNLRKATLGPDHWRTLVSMQRLAYSYSDQPYANQGDHVKAERLLRETLALQRKAEDTEAPWMAMTLGSLGWNLLKQQRHGDAEPVLREWLATRGKKEPDIWNTFNIKSMLGEALLGQTKYADAEPLLVQGYDGLKQREAKIPAEDKVRLTEALERLVQLYEALDKQDEAARWRAELASRKTPPKEEKKLPPKK